MKKYLYLLTISFSLISCYTYRIKSETDGAGKDGVESPVNSKEQEEKRLGSKQASLKSKTPQSSKTNKNKNPGQPMSIQEKLEANKYFKIEVGGKPYKIQVDKWESDTLVAHVIHKPKKILKFHKNQINQSTVAERRFSQPTADIITVVAYAAVGVGIWALVK
ncbi:hypothetical protein LUD75_06120 [Epilithonimonas sp. JDS]|uniref:hypothetical protein n=1 Tax=Epilithonimonas sp. JDS TaxID=2902797 RepID=UPI001E441B95|nr:hypothetical protein [Epilithonimonas sp. JDS]MCD9854271.1 hypothetical protein [Epilithonimonas sp. JDS]